MNWYSRLIFIANFATFKTFSASFDCHRNLNWYCYFQLWPIGKEDTLSELLIVRNVKNDEETTKCTEVFKSNEIVLIADLPLGSHSLATAIVSHAKMEIRKIYVSCFSSAASTHSTPDKIYFNRFDAMRCMRSRPNKRSNENMFCVHGKF